MKSCVVLALLLLPLTAVAALQTTDPFPSFDLGQGLTAHDRAYLGLGKGLPFYGKGARLNEVRAQLLFVVFMNRYCVTCQKQAPELVAFQEELEKDRNLGPTVKILGVAIGNSTREVNEFRRDYGIRFPIAADADASIFRSAGSPGGSPLFIILKRKGAEWAIVNGFKGERSRGELLLLAAAGMKADLTFMTRKPVWVEEPLKTLTQHQALAIIRKEVPSALLVKSMTFDNGNLYILSAKKEMLFAKVECRRLPCSVCHDIIFIYVFDRKGIVREMIPVELAKDLNRPFSPADIRQIRSSVVGRNMLAPFRFDKDVDAVTSATLTSFAVHDAIFHGKELVDAIRREGY